MKRFISLTMALLVMSVTADAAIYPNYFTTNPVAVAGSSPSSALAALGGVSLNNFTLNTNTVVVSGAGDTAQNGTYNWSISQQAYIRSGGSALIYWDVPNGPFWDMSNSVSGVEAYFSTATSPVGIVNTLWQVGNGSGNAPTSYCPTNIVQLQSGTNSMHLWYVDPLQGADVNAGHDPYNALQTVSNALTRAFAGDTIVALPGVHSLPNFNHVGFGISIIGYGKGVTILTNSSGQSYLALAGTNYLADFTSYLYYTSLANSGDTGSNCVLLNIDTHSKIDGIIPGASGGWNLYNCDFYSKYDTFNEPTAEHAVFNFYNCGFHVLRNDANDGVYCRGIALTSSTVNLYGGEIDITNNATTNTTACLAFEGTGGVVNVAGTVMSCAGTNVYVINKDVANGYVSGGTVNFLTPFGATNFIPAAASSAITVTFPNYQSLSATIATTANLVVTNAPTFQATNAKPSNVTIGTTVADLWITITNNGTVLWIPAWRNH